MILIAGYTLLVQTFLTSHAIVLYLLITFGIATGLAMCRLGEGGGGGGGGVISAQNVIF